MEPWADVLALLDRARAPGQGHERTLEGVLGIVLLTEDATADTENHRTVAFDQDPESVRVIRGDETLQKLTPRHCTTLLEPFIPIRAAT